MRLIHAGGELRLAIEYRKGYQESDGNHLPPNYVYNPTVQSGILLDLWIYNYDRTPWNMMYQPGDDFGKVLFIDFGAALMCRAQGTEYKDSGNRGQQPN